MQVAIARGDLEFIVLRELPHSLLKISSEFFILAIEQDLHIARGLLVFLLRAKPFDAWAETAF